MKLWKHSARIECSPAFVAVLCLLFYLDPGGLFLRILAASALHEAGHLLILRLLGVPILRLRLYMSGAILQTPLLAYRRELLAAAAGPAVNALLFYASVQTRPAFALINFALLVYNLLPFYPLDGGRILRALLRDLLGERLGTWIELAIEALCLALLLCAAIWLTCVLHIGLWPIVVYACLLLRIARTQKSESKKLSSNS